MQQLLTYMFGHVVCGVDIITSTFNYMLNGECIISVMSSQVSGYKCAAHNKKIGSFCQILANVGQPKSIINHWYYCLSTKWTDGWTLF